MDTRGLGRHVRPEDANRRTDELRREHFAAFLVLHGTAFQSRKTRRTLPQSLCDIATFGFVGAALSNRRAAFKDLPISFTKPRAAERPR